MGSPAISCRRMPGRPGRPAAKLLATVSCADAWARPPEPGCNASSAWTQPVDAAALELTAVAGIAPRSGGRPGGLPKGRPSSGPIRLTVVLDLTFVGGVETLLLNLFRNFDPAVVRPRLVCLREAGPLADDFRAAGSEIETLDRTGRFDLRTLPRLVASLRADRTDAVLVPHHHRASLALGRLAAVIAKVPVNIVAAHDMDLASVGGRVCRGGRCAPSVSRMRSSC